MKNSAGVVGLTRARAAVLDELSAQPDPVSIGALAIRLGRHPNTVREQIAWLLRRGLIRRHRVPTAGRGRPSWHYEAVGPSAGGDDHAELAAHLAWQLGEVSRDARPESLRVGRRWGSELSLARGVEPAPSPEEARRRTVGLLAELGYRPEPDAQADRVALTRCPLLQAAHQHPEVVCAVHLGLVRSVLEAHGGDPARAELEPFSAPGRCSLRLHAPLRSPGHPD